MISCYLSYLQECLCLPDAVEEMMIRAGKHQKAMMKAQQNYLQRK